MKRSKNQELFIDILIRFNQKIVEMGKLNILSHHIYSENFFRDLLNNLYNYSLGNLNSVERNAEAIDLIDYENKIIVQVSSSATRLKIENTLKKEKILDRALQGYTMKFLFIGIQDNKLKEKDFKNPHNIQFEAKKDIIFREDLNEKFLDVTIEVQDKIIELLTSELSPLLFEENYSFIKEDFLNKHTDLSLSNLESRYSDELDIETINNQVIEAIAITKQFKEKNMFFLNNIKLEIEEITVEELSSVLNEIESKEFFEVFKLLKKTLNVFISSNKIFENKLTDLNEIINTIQEFITTFKEIYNINDFKLNNTYNEKITKWSKSIEKEIFNYLTYLNNTEYKCLFNPYLIIKGNAGIGKSHLIGHLTKKLREDNYLTYLFLGQFFEEKVNPWQQMRNYLDIDISFDNFLRVLNDKAIETNKRAFIIIDALNEGAGRVLWKKHFQNFISRIKKYENISIIISVRTPFENYILSDEIINRNNISVFVHKGFSEENYVPILSFCDFYKIETPKFPILNKEYENPLFLKLVCEYIEENTKVFKPYLDRSQLFGGIIDRININLSDAEKFNFDPSIKVIQDIIYEIIKGISKEKYKSIEYNEAYRIVNEVSKNYYLQNANRILEALIDENILSKNKSYGNKEIVYFTYERIGDYFLIDYILKDYNFEIPKTELINQLNNDLRIQMYFGNESSVSFNQELLEELAIRIADKTGIELFEVFSEKYIDYYLPNALINSLIWRKAESISETTKNYITDNIFPNKYYRLSFLDVMLMKIADDIHPLNVYTLNRLLNNLQLPMRDVFWTEFISKDSENAFKVIDWLYDNYQSIDSKESELYSIAIAWFLTSTNKKLRDISTKVLVLIFQQYPFLMLKLLNLFKNIDDHYVTERIYAAINGAILRSKTIECFEEIVEFIYEEIFNRNIVYPHVLIRDYARQIIEFFVKSQNNSYFDLNKIRPPYKSEWYSKSFTNEEIDNYIEEIKKPLKQREKQAIDRILSSMTTEYGRGVGSYGDFGRYVFGHSVKRWKNQFEDDQELANIIIMRVFEIGYNPKLHANYDLNVSTFDRHNNSIERIGKKYQWIAFHELLAKLSDNFDPYIEKIVYTEEVEKFLIKNPTKKLKIIEDVGEDKTNLEIEVKCDVSDFLEEVEDEEKYIKEIIRIPSNLSNLTWEEYIRDIDPTIVIKKIENTNLKLFSKQLPINPTKEWIMNSSIINNTKGFLEIEIEGKMYISLSVTHSEENRNRSSKYVDKDSFFFSAVSYFYKIENEQSIIDDIKKNYGNGLGMPMTSKVFLYELFWADSYKDFLFGTEREFNYKIDAVHDYLWEKDASFKNGSVSFNVPGKSIVDYFSLFQKREGFWVDSNGELVCFNGLFNGYDNDSVLIDKEKLFVFLKDKNYSIGWKIYTEKVSERYFKECWYDALYDNGIYTEIISKEQSSNYDELF